MKKTGINIAVLMVICLMPSLLRAEGFRYESHGRRDPLVPLVGQEKSSNLKLEDISSIEDIKLEGIAVVGKGKRTAILNGEILKEGDKVGDIEIKKITADTVNLTIGGKAYELKLSEEGGAKSEP